MSQSTNVDMSRRDFLSGQWRGKSNISARCLNRSGIYCQSCKDSCDEEAIVFNQAKMGIQLPTIISERCTHCMDCVDGCPTGAITINDEKP